MPLASRTLFGIPVSNQVGFSPFSCISCVSWFLPRRRPCPDGGPALAQGELVPPYGHWQLARFLAYLYPVGGALCECCVFRFLDTFNFPLVTPLSHHLLTPLISSPLPQRHQLFKHRATQRPLLPVPRRVRRSASRPPRLPGPPLLDRQAPLVLRLSVHGDFFHAQDR